MVEKINLKERRKFEAIGAPRERNYQIGKTVEEDKNEEDPRGNGKEGKTVTWQRMCLRQPPTF
ncbi:hypothetical protein IFM47457_08497 [Aspergillus lentulus]|nr:hypothetical protein IFM47457_08497 [Aspergillus lentulus]